MKTPLYILLASALMLTGCTNNKKADNSVQMSTAAQNTDATAASADGTVTYLSTADFRLKIMDYETHQTEWVFEGKRPAVIDF